MMRVIHRIISSFLLLIGMDEQFHKWWYVKHAFKRDKSDKTLVEVLDWCTLIVEMEGIVPEEVLIENLRMIYDFLYINNGGDYYLITYDRFFDLLNKYRDKMGEKYQIKKIGLFSGEFE